MWFYKEGAAITPKECGEMMENLVREAALRFGAPRRALLLPPDITRLHSGAGALTESLYHLLKNDATVHVIPTLGQHVPHTEKENKMMFPTVPEECILKHDWQNHLTRIGSVSAQFAKTATGGAYDAEIPIDLNSAVTEGGYDLIVNIGQVVPHEVLGFANHNKNYFIGLGGRETICASHIAAALCGIENNMGQTVTPLRGIYNYAEKEFLEGVNSVFVLIVKSEDEEGNLVTTGLYVGEDIQTYIKAARFAREKTVHLLEKPLKKVVCYMDGREFQSTWVANKAVYRTRKAVDDGGELLIIAPGVKRFGEQPDVDALIRKYGYKGTPRALDAYKNDPRMNAYAHAAAHLIHGSSEGRFHIVYAPGHLTWEEIEGVGYGYMHPGEALQKYNPEKLHSGFNVVDGEEIYFIKSPSLGLWSAKSKFKEGLINNLHFAKRMIAAYPGEKLWKDLEKWDTDDIEMLGL